MDKTLVKGLTLIELLANSASTRGVSEIARELGLTKSNVHRLLMTLEAQGYVQKPTHNSGYELTSKLWEIGARVRSRLDVLRVSHGPMAKLEQETGESVHLSIMNGRDVIYVDKLEGSHPIKAYTAIGGRAPVWCVATGKALLAHAPREIVDEIVLHLTRFTARSIIDGDVLRTELNSIQRDGYAVNREEWREGVSGVAAPVHDATGKVVAAVGISGPATRFRQKDIKPRAVVVLQAAASISEALGYRSDSILQPGSATKTLAVKKRRA